MPRVDEVAEAADGFAEAAVPIAPGTMRAVPGEILSIKRHDAGPSYLRPVD